MKRLAIDTATRATSVAACDGQRTFEARDDPEPEDRPGHARRVLPLAAEVLERAGWELSAVEQVVVGRGPGSFTGLRIGIATAHGLATGLGVPLIGVSTLESLARAAPDGGAAVLAVLDARRGEVFIGAWQQANGRLAPVIAPEVLDPARLAGVARRLGAPLALGDGAVEWREALEGAGASVPRSDSPLHRVSASVHCRLALDAPATGAAVLPEYLRLPDAEIARRGAQSDGT